MSIENPTLEQPQTLFSEQAEQSAAEQAAEITILPLDSFKLVGGGTGITELG
jgi:hypothetical protein